MPESSHSHIQLDWTELDSKLGIMFFSFFASVFSVLFSRGFGSRDGEMELGANLEIP